MIRRRNVHTLHEKLKVIEEIENNPKEKKIHIAKRLGIAPSTLASIWARKKKIRSQIEKYGQLSSKRKSSKESKFKDLEVIVYSWYQESLADNIPMNGLMIREKAKEIAESLGISDFTASSGWISRFKERHCLVKKHRKDPESGHKEKYWLDGSPTMVKSNRLEFSSVIRTSCFSKELSTTKTQNTGKTTKCDEELFEEESSSKWLEELPTLFNGHEPQDIYSLHETGLFYYCLPESVPWLKDESCHDGRKSKERLSVLFCVNCDGSDKRLPFIIGKATKPRCFKNLKQLPAPYYSNAKAWFTTETLSLFLKTLDTEMNAEGRNILLFMEDCETHCTYTYLKNIKVIHYPSNCYSVFQPLHRIIKVFKAHYRKELVKKAISLMALIKAKDDQHTVRINILQAMHLILRAWESVKQSTIANSFKSSGFSSSCHFENISKEEDIEDFEEWKKIEVPLGVDFNSYVDVDSSLFASGIRSPENSLDISETEENYQGHIPTYSQACTAFLTLKAFLNSQDLNEEQKAHITCLENFLSVMSCPDV